LKPEIKVVISLAFSLLVFEVLSRSGESYLSADVRQMLAQDEIPQKIREVKRDGRASILVIGNSLARAGIIPDEIARSIRSPNGGTAEVFYITPDASGINEWAAAYRRGFPDAPDTERPDLVLIVTGPGHLADQLVTSPERLSAYHVAEHDRWEVGMNWLPGLGERCRFALAGASRLFANRERVRPLLFYRLVPGYEVTAQRLNQSINSGKDLPVERDESAERFGLLLDSLGIPPERVLIAAVPLPWQYELPEAVLAEASARNIFVYGEAAASTWPSVAFPDGYHIAPEFGRVFSRQLGDLLRRRVRASGEALGDPRSDPFSVAVDENEKRGGGDLPQ